MLVELLADAEGVVQLLHEQLLLGCQLVGCCRVDGGEMAALHLVFMAVDVACLALIVDGIEQAAILHPPFRMPHEDAGFLLELDDGDGLVHTGRQLEGLVVHAGIGLQQTWHKLLAGVVAVDFKRKGGQRYEVDAVLLDGRQVGVSQTEAQYVADAGIVACRCSHPENVVVAPLDIPGVILSQGVHNLVGSRASVVDIAQNVELVDGQSLYDVADGTDEIVGASRRDDGIDNDGHVGSLVLVVCSLVEQFLDDIGEVLRQRLAYLATSILAADIAAHLHQLMDGDAIPVVDVLLLGLDEFELLLRIVDEGAEFFLLRLPYVVAE